MKPKKPCRSDAEFLRIVRAAQLRAIREGKTRAAEQFAKCIAKLRRRIAKEGTTNAD